MRVSILIPCFNACRWVRSAIESALAQSWPDKEVIVVDDGSTDGSLDVIRSFGNAVRWESGPNRGGNVARTRLLELATGEWLQYLDADDWLLSEHVANQAAVAAANPQADVIYSPGIMQYWPEGDQHVDPSSPRCEILSIPEPQDPWILLIRWYLPQTGAALWRRTALREVGNWKVDQPCCQEHELYLRLLSAGKHFVFNPKPGAVYRQWSTDTVCRRNPLETFRQRLAVVAASEKYLSHTDALTDGRRRAISLTRLECARSIYQFDRRLASQIAAEARCVLHLPDEAAFPPAYRAMYRVMGFETTEAIARYARSMRRVMALPRRFQRIRRAP